MESKVRHDLRHPIATISMIASTLAEFGDSVDGETASMYGEQVSREIKGFADKMKQHSVAFDTEKLEQAASLFVDDPSVATRAAGLEAECRKLLELLSPAVL
ncbi:MAG: hypothetical protein ABR507_02155 [Actinomycetota bacterium]|nr:hypothetical protein [Actinomycetota bacterium]